MYSIWVCMNVQNYRADSIQEYGLTEKVIHGAFHDNLQNYDLIKIIVLNLGKNATTHRLLGVLMEPLLEIAAEEAAAETEKMGVEYIRNLMKTMKRSNGRVASSGR